MSLSKVQHSDCYTQLCNRREEFALIPISNQLNILVGCYLSLTRSLPWSLLISYREMDGLSSVV